MSTKNFWLLGFLMAVLVFGGLASPADAAPVIDDIKIEAHDADNEPDNPYGIRLARVTVEGQLDDDVSDVLGTVNLVIDANGNGVIDGGETTIQVIQGDAVAGGHELRVTSGTSIVSNGADDMIETNRDGEFIFSFLLPADIVGTADVTLIMWFGNEEGDLDPAIYDTSLLGTLPADAGKRDFEFAVQVPVLKDGLEGGQVSDDIYRNGDRVEVQMEYETPAGGPPLSDGEEVELLTILPDFSNVDSAFALGNSCDPITGDPLTSLGPLANDTAGRYDLTRWDETNTDPADLDLYDLALDVARAIRDNRLRIDVSGGDYDLAYIISENNLNSSGRKRLFVYAVDFPSSLSILDAPLIFANNTPPLPFPGSLNVSTWATCNTETCYDDDYGDILLDNMAPNFDFAVIDPFVNPPLRKWDDFDGDGVIDPDEWAYVYKEGDKIRVMVQIDPHDLTEEELNEVDPDELSDDGNENGTVSNITIIGDISALLDPSKVDLITDANRNGIPDDAEIYTVEYAGSNGEDDDFDGGVEDNVDDDEDSTSNGFNERFLYILLIDVTDKFRGVSGDRPFTTEGLPIRFMMEDDSGNRSYFSTWREALFDYDIWQWKEVPLAGWGRDPGPLEGVRNPMYLDPDGEDEVFEVDGVYEYPPTNPNFPEVLYSSISHEPTPARAGMPPWSPGANILANWNQPSRVIIDAAYSNVSKIRSVQMEVGHSDAGVADGAAVVPLPGENNINWTPPTTLTGGREIMGEGSFIYEITGNGDSLVTLEAFFPSDDDMYFVKFEYSDDGVSYEPMRGSFNDFQKANQFMGGALPRESLLLYDIAGNVTDDMIPGAQYGVWHDGVNGDDDDDDDPDLFDQEVDDAHSAPLSDGIDNDADGLVDMDDRDENNIGTEVYDRTRDDDEDGIMDEDAYVVPARLVNPAQPPNAFTNPYIARWTFDPVAMARLLDLMPDRVYAIRATAFDRAGNSVEKAAAPIYVVFRVTGKGVNEVSGDATAQLYLGDQLITQRNISENLLYDLKATTSGIVSSVTFERSTDRKNWESVVNPNNPDKESPFKISWRPKLVGNGVDEDSSHSGGDPGPEFEYEPGTNLYINAVAGNFGKLGKYEVVDGLVLDPQGFIPYQPPIEAPPSEEDNEPDITVAIGDITAPVLIITKMGVDDNMSDGALVPVASDVLMVAESTVDPAVSDISDAYWESAKVFPNGTRANWTRIECSTDLTILPGGAGVLAIAKWDTRGYGVGRYDVRCVSVDNSGNSDPQLAPIVHVVIGRGKKAAFIVDPKAGASFSGAQKVIKARIYDQWTDKNTDGVLDELDVAMDVKRVIFQYQSPGGVWQLADVAELATVVSSNYAEFEGVWNLYDLMGNYYIKAMVEDDKGYVNDGIELLVTVSGPDDMRVKISNFESDATSNPRVSMQIARDGSVPDIKIQDYKDIPAEKIRIKLKAEQLPGTPEPPDVKFQYKIAAGVDENGVPIDPVANPKSDDGWTTIATDNGPAWEKDWDIAAGHELHNLQVATLVYVRAVAYDGSTPKDGYIDEGNYVPYVGMIFEETTEPVCTIERLERDGTVMKSTGGLENLWYDVDGDGNIELFENERRIAGGVLNVIPAVFDPHSAGNAQQFSAIAQVELYYKLCTDPSRDGDTLKWQRVGDPDTEPPFMISWDVSDVPTGKYELLMVATDQAGNRSANPWNQLTDSSNNDGLRDEELTRILTIDNTGPVSYVENPDAMSNGGRLPCNRQVVVAVSSYEGCVRKILLQYSSQRSLEEIEDLTQEGTYTFTWQDLNGNGLYDAGEPFRIIGLPEDVAGGEWVEGGGGVEVTWIKIDEVDFAVPSFSSGDVYTDFVSQNDGYGYYYYDENGNKRFDAGEVVWKDREGGNTRRYNYHKRTAKEPIIMGGIRPDDEFYGRKFEDIPGDIKGLTCVQGVAKWADVNGDGELDDMDFIWIDVPDDDGVYNDAYDCEFGGVGEPVVYGSNAIYWRKIMDLPPTNDTPFDLRALASDKKDSANKDGNWGPESIGPVRVENIVVAIWKINGRKIENNYDSWQGIGIGSGKDYKDKYMRVTGDTVELVVRVWPEPISGADVQLWFKYDEDLYPGGEDGDYNGYPDDGDVANSKWDGIDNDWDGTIDEEQRDKDGNNKKWGEVNVWRLANTTGGTVVTGQKSGDYDDGPGKNWFEVTLTWNISDLEGEFQYEIQPVVVDAMGFGVELDYADLPFVTSDAVFPQTYEYPPASPEEECPPSRDPYKIIVDHQGPYTYTQVVQDTDEYKSDELTLDSWEALVYECDPCDDTPPLGDDMIIRTNDGPPGDPNDKRKGSGDYTDDPGEDEYTTYDVQAKVVSIYGGLDYTKTFTDQTGGVEFQYRELGGEWKTLGYDYDPDYMSTFELPPEIFPISDIGFTPTYDMVAVAIPDRWDAQDPNYFGDMWNKAELDVGNIRSAYPGWQVDSGGTPIYSDQNGNGEYDVGEEIMFLGFTQRIVVATYSLDNINIADNSVFPATNGTEYEFRTITSDNMDVYGGAKNTTDPANTSKFDEYVVENRVGDGKTHASNDMNWMRDVNWEKGVPFEAPAVVATGDIFRKPHKDVANLEAVRGPRSDGDKKDTNYWVNNLVPKAEIMRVDETSFAWTSASGIDPVALAEEIDATVHEGEHVLFEAIVNPDPDGKIGGVWGTDTDTSDDLKRVAFYARPYPPTAKTNPDYYKGWHMSLADPECNIVANGWMQVGMGVCDDCDEEAMSDTNAAPRYTIRVDTSQLVADLSKYDSKGVPLDTRDFQMMALAVDNNCNMEPLMAKTGEIIIRVLDMVGPTIKVGGLALDTEHYNEALDRAGCFGTGSGVMGPFLSTPFTDIAGLDLNNFSNAVFPANPYLMGSTRLPMAKVSGEVLQLYVASGLYDDLDSVVVSVYGEDNLVVAKPSVEYAKDTWKKSTETTPGSHEVYAGKVSHKFVLSEQSALLYLPTWVDGGANVSRFEQVWLHYKRVNNAVWKTEENGLEGSGSMVGTQNPYFGDKKTMTRSINSKGEQIWTVDMDLELGSTYFYYFVVDTVGDTWCIPDPKNLMFDEVNPGTDCTDSYNLMEAWFKGPGGYTMHEKFYMNLSFVSKMWVPGTPDGKGTKGLVDPDTGESIEDSYEIAADDELWVASIDLDSLADGVYRVEVKATDKVGYTSTVQKTIVVDRTAPPVDPEADIHVDSRVKADAPAQLVAILHDPVDSPINVVDTLGVLFQASRRGNDADAVSVWRYAMSAAAPVPYEPEWLGPPALDTDSSDGWSVMWHTPKTDQNIKWYVRAVPFDDALNPQVAQTNYSETVVDGTVPMAEIVRASVTRDGEVKEADAKGFELYPTDTDVVLTAEMVANIDGDLDNDGIIEPDSGEDINLGLKGMTFQYSLSKATGTGSAIKWITIPFSQYSDAVRVPNADGKWQVTWQIDFSQIANETKDQYIHVRAVAEDEVGHNKLEYDESGNLKALDEEPIFGIMVLNNTTGPQAYIEEVDGNNVLSPHLAVSKRCSGEKDEYGNWVGDPGAVDVQIEAHNVAAVVLEYRAAGDTSWTEIKTQTAAQGSLQGEFTIEWVVVTLDEGRYELRVSAFDGDGNMATEPDVVVVIVDHTEPEVSGITMWVDEDRDGFEGSEIIHPGDDIYRYKQDGGDYYNVKIQAVADATDPVDKVEAKKVVLQYFDSVNAEWVTVLMADGSESEFSYSKVSDKWTKEFKDVDTDGDEIADELNALGHLIPQTAAEEDGKLWLRVLVEDYACNQNKLDKGFELDADAHAPEIIAVYSGGRDWEGGDSPTIVAYGGDPVDLWVKLRDPGTGVGFAKFCVEASNRKNANPGDNLPVPATSWDEIGPGELYSTNGDEEIWHYQWSTPLNMAESPWTYDIAVHVGDKAGNELSCGDTHYTGDYTAVKVEKDVTPPAAPEVLFVVTHAGRVTGDNSLPEILDEYNAPYYDDNSYSYWDDAPGRQYVRKLLPISNLKNGAVVHTPTNKDALGADKYEVFDLHNDWDKNDKQYIDPDQYDTSLEIWVRTPELEFGEQPGVSERRQYEKYEPDNSDAPDGNGMGDHDGPKYLKVNYGALGHDPGINRVYIDIAYAGPPDMALSEVDPAAISDWVPLDDKQEEAGDNSGPIGKYMDPRKNKGGWYDKPGDCDVEKKQEPLEVGSAERTGKYGDVVRVPLYSDAKTDKLEGYAYYWVMGDDNYDEGSNGEVVWNTEASKDNKSEELDSKLARDGVYVIRTWAEDTSCNGNPKKDADDRQFGYALIRVRNQDNVAPANTYVKKLNGDDDTSKWNVMEWKWHMVEVRTKRNEVGLWHFGATANSLAKNTNRKFFGDLDYVVVEAWDNVCGEWVNVTRNGKWYDRSGKNGDFYSGNLSAFETYWTVPIDSTLVGDGDSMLRAYAVDNGGILVNGYQKVHEQHSKDARRNKEDKDSVPTKDIMVDNPRAQVVMPASGYIVERGDSLQIQAVPVSPNGDPARNGHDVGQMCFLIRRKAAPDGGTNGPWILVDALDDDHDGRFGEDPITDEDRDKDGKTGEDDIDPADTNAPYMVYWEVPDWLVIDDPKTETVIEQTAEYWVVAVAGDSNTGPLDKTGQKYWDGEYWVEETPSDGFIHWDSPYHIIDTFDCDPRAALVTVVDEHPPRTRVLQVDNYAVPSEIKMVVGKTVKVYAGDTEIDWIPPGTFPTPIWDKDSFANWDDIPYNNPVGSGSSGGSVDMEDKSGPAWPNHGAAWTIGMLYPPRYDPDVKPEKYLYDEWRPNSRVQLRYAGPYDSDAATPGFPASGQTWADTDWKVAEADARDLDRNGDPGRPKWEVYNWTTGGSVLPDGKYFITVTATDDVGHTTGETIGNAEPVTPHVVEIWIDNEGPEVTLTASELQPNGTLEIVTNGQMERGRAMVLSIDPTMAVADLDSVTFMYKAVQDYSWNTIKIDTGAAVSSTQPYSVTLSPLGGWSGISEEPQNIALGNVYQFKAVATDSIGNRADSNILELLVVDKVAEASIARVRRLDGFNADEVLLVPRMLGVPRLTGRVRLRGYTDADVVGVTFLYRPQGAASWTEMEAILNIRDFGVDPWEMATWLNDGIDNDCDGLVDEPGECGYHYEGQQEWDVVWDTTTLNNGMYELAVVANTGENKSDVSDILMVVVDHNAYDILDLITDSSPRSGEAVGGECRRIDSAMNPILDPDDKLACRERGEVDIYVAFAGGLPADLDMGIPTGVIRDNDGEDNDDDCDDCEPVVDEFDENLMPEGSQLKPSLMFEYKESSYPDIGDETIHEKPNMSSSHWYWKPICSIPIQEYDDDYPPSTELRDQQDAGCVVYDAATGRFTAVWKTVKDEILNGYYDLRVKVVDEAGNVAYKVIAEGVIVDNTPPAAMITNVNGDTSLTSVDGGMATDTELPQDSNVVIRATAIDSLTSVATVQFQVKQATMQVGRPLPGNRDEVNLGALDLTDWTDIGLATRDDDPENSYSLHWDTTGLLEGDYLLRVGVKDVLCNNMFSDPIKVTVIDTVPPVATIVGYYPEQLQFLYLLWPQKCNIRMDYIYAMTDCPDIQEVQIQYTKNPADPDSWITIGVPALIPFEGLESPEDKADDLRTLYKKNLIPEAVKWDQMILEAFDWDGLWGAAWKPKLDDGTYYLRAVAKDWSGNRDADLAPLTPVSVVDGVVHPFTPASGMSIEFTANLGGTGVGDVAYVSGPSYDNTPSVVLTVEAPEKPKVLVLVEVDSEDGVVFGGELVDVREEEGASGRYTAALKGDELVVWIGNQWVPLDNYLTLLRLGGKITAFATTSAGTVSTSMTMDDLRVFRVTAELGTNGTVSSKDSAVKVMVPRAALYEPSGDYVEQAGLMITPCVTPNTPKDQRLILEPVGQAYSIEMFDYLSNLYFGFRPGFEPLITIDYSGFGLPPVEEALGFISVRYWQPNPNGMGGWWSNDDIINMSVDEAANTVKFNLKSFGSNVYTGGNSDASSGTVVQVPHHIFSIVLEKSLGRIDGIVFEDGYQYPADPDMTYLTDFDSEVFFKIVDPGGIDEDNIRIYLDGELISVGLKPREFSRCVLHRIDEDGDRTYMFDPEGHFRDILTEGFHTLKIEAWDKSDAVNEADWRMLEKTVSFFIDRTAPLVVTHAAQRDGIRYFRSTEGAVAAITIVDEGVGLSAKELQSTIFVDVFKHLTSENTPMRTIDQGNIINFQRKVLQATSRPILEYADDYTPDGIDNETWTGIHDGASDERHQAWRASYTIQVGQIDDGDTYEVVFYAVKPKPMVVDHYNENAIYLYEDLAKAYLRTSEECCEDGCCNYAVDLGELNDLYQAGLLDMTVADPFTGYYIKTFLKDILGNHSTKVIMHPPVGTEASVGSDNSGEEGHLWIDVDADEFFVRHLVADTRSPKVVLQVPDGVRADDSAATVSASIVDDGSGIQSAALIVNGDVVSEKTGPASNLSLDYTFGAGEAETANEIKLVVTDVAGNEYVERASFGVQEVDAPVIADMTPQGDGVMDATPAIGASYSDLSGIDLDSVTLTLNGAVIPDITVGASKVSYTPTEPLEAGVTYTVRVAVEDTAGAASDAIWTFSLEADAPSITDTTPSGVDETGTPVISAKFADEGVGIDTSSVRLMVDQRAVAAEVTDSSVAFTPGSVMESGKHTATVQVADVAGNAAEHSWDFTIEEDAPSITDVAPNGTINTDRPVLSASYSDAGTGIDVRSVTLSLDGDVVPAEVTATKVSFGVAAPLEPRTTHTVAITVADRAGNEASVSRTFRLETTAPSITNLLPASGSTVQSVDVAISANYSDAGSGVIPATAVMKLDGAALKKAVASASGISYQATGLVAGAHAVYVEVADSFGNVASQSWSFNVEQTPPVISSLSPQGEVSEAKPALSVSYSDAGSGIDVDSVVFTLNGVVLDAAAVTESQASFQVTTPLEVGVTYKISIEVADKAGNIASDSGTFTLETTPPKISSTKPNGTVDEDEAAAGVMISANLSDDGSGVDPESVIMWLDGDVVDADATAESVQYMARGLRYGDHQVRVVVADMLGNFADDDWDFSVADSTPPTVTVVSPKQDGVVGVKPLIKISYADEGSGVDLTSVSVKVDGEAVPAVAMAPAKPSGAKVVSAGEASYEIKLGYGAHTLTVAVKDVAGNEATAEVSFTVEGDVLKLVKPHNFPNPFKGSKTTITFGLSQASEVTVRIYDFTAALVATVVEDEPTPASENVQIVWDGTTDSGDGDMLANGVYFCKILVKTDSETKYEIVKIALARE